MNKELFFIIGNISSLVIIVPIVFAILKYNRLNKVQVSLGYILILVFIVELITNIFWHKKINNLPIFHFYAIFEFLLIVNIYKSALSGLFSKGVFIILAIGFTAFAIINMFFFQNIFEFNSNVTTVMGVLVVFFALSYFYKLLKEVRYSALETNPMFWINSGFLIYFSSNLILFFINNNLFKEASEASYMVWGLHAIVNIILILFYTIAIWVKPKEQ
ncbi:hypothetical protein D1816_17165 [Aquimarina sp. AD10]|uniref:Uncharacterized protein n=1 Tax=Aquimarina aggregata TaxID=1642818 RepID=A0A162ZB96_9FLAO|nr:MULTISPECIES: hypothetical protein [Aquimarina]AXT62014.1 hypothetical protein D1816_17165 [Aquimarina sp. AD10]KZS39689.1 hypothetical protein AWE51_08540 [Aquimarina aggregata]RKN02473.1 hypothetical protein D7033_01280 [Aquimarina sp. AD10]